MEFYDQNDSSNSLTHARSFYDDEFLERTRCHESIFSRRRHDLNPAGKKNIQSEDPWGVWPSQEERDLRNVFSSQTKLSGQIHNHRGKGPKGYKRSSERILEDACDRLMGDSRIDATDVQVEFNDGVLILKGLVRTKDEKRRAEFLMENLSGVRDVFNQLHVKQQ
jgi:hypothetical protein